MACSLHNYLRTYRKRAGLSQLEVARLCGDQSRSSVRRHEDGGHPTLNALLQYMVIYGVSPKKLFEGRYEELEAEVRTRATEMLEAMPLNGKAAESRPRISAIADPNDPVIVPLWEED